MSEQIFKGLFRVEEEMPCRPEDIREWYIPVSLGKAEPELVVTLVLRFSQRANEWVGVSQDSLFEEQKEESRLERKILEAENKNHKERLRFNRAMKRYTVFCFLTRGIWKRLWKQPSLQMLKVPEEKNPMIGFLTPGFFKRGIDELIDRGLVREVRKGYNDSVFFPTSNLVTMIMDQQGIKKKG